MTQIAHVRTFNGTSDYIQCAAGSSPADMGPVTMACIVRLASVSATRFLLSTLDSGFTQGGGFGTAGVNGRAGLYVGGSDLQSAASWLVTGEWYLLAATKASGTVAARHHRYLFDTDTWTHANSAGTGGDGTANASRTPFIGAARSGNFFAACDVAVGAMWDTALSDGDLETLTDDLDAWEALSPDSLWLLNQTDVTTAVDDLSGNGADQTARSGTTVLALSDLAFDVGGVEAEAVTRDITLVL